MDHEKEFERIAEEAIAACEAVKCSFADFADGIRCVANALKDRSDMARDEARPMDDE